jgi:hypothetical protein
MLLTTAHSLGYETRHSLLSGREPVAQVIGRKIMWLTALRRYTLQISQYIHHTVYSTKQSVSTSYYQLCKAISIYTILSTLNAISINTILSTLQCSQYLHHTVYSAKQSVSTSYCLLCKAISIYIILSTMNAISISTLQCSQYLHHTVYYAMQSVSTSYCLL